jgi:hypothetical protein
VYYKRFTIIWLFLQIEEEMNNRYFSDHQCSYTNALERIEEIKLIGNVIDRAEEKSNLDSTVNAIKRFFCAFIEVI